MRDQYTRADAEEACEAVAAVLREHGIKGPEYDHGGDELVYARQIVGALWLMEEGESIEEALVDALSERVQPRPRSVAQAAAYAIERAWRLLEEAQRRRRYDGTSQRICAKQRQVPLSRFAEFAQRLQRGEHPDVAARAVGGTGRPGTGEAA